MKRIVFLDGSFATDEWCGNGTKGNRQGGKTTDGSGKPARNV